MSVPLLLPAQGGIPDYERALLAKVGKWCRLFGEAVYEPVPAPKIKCKGRDFVLKNGKNYYYFVHDLGVLGDANVTAMAQGLGSRALDGFTAKVKSVKYLDNGEELRFTQNADAGMPAIFCTGYTYGTNYVVRVVKIETE